MIIHSIDANPRFMSQVLGGTIVNKRWYVVIEPEDWAWRSVLHSEDHRSRCDIASSPPAIVRRHGLGLSHLSPPFPLLHGIITAGRYGRPPPPRLLGGGPYSYSNYSEIRLARNALRSLGCCRIHAISVWLRRRRRDVHDRNKAHAA
jgi:hypothetical protein